MDDQRIRESWSELVRDTIGDTPFNVVSEKVGVSANTISNWVRGENYKRPDGPNVFRFAKAFGIPVPEALVRAGIGDEGDYVGEIIVKPDISAYTTKELLAEIMKRESEESSPKDQPRVTGVGGTTKVKGKTTKAGATRQAKLQRARNQTPL
ncbi:helix-turn-helix domain-containing protein [Mycolicibacterium houstonense]|uniref:helix-turn-helix domain-containing protein n=1 Tax=Mycolicibacterium houstonense TaxID=146021 RepID=UPI000834415F|nr:helix-turn-helix transcriptional regulator [Mycolicibacterium houstonense]